jgi:hypothetical protein
MIMIQQSKMISIYWNSPQWKMLSSIWESLWNPMVISGRILISIWLYSTTLPNAYRSDTPLDRPLPPSTENTWKSLSSSRGGGVEGRLLPGSIAPPISAPPPARFSSPSPSLRPRPSRPSSHFMENTYFFRWSLLWF